MPQPSGPRCWGLGVCLGKFEGWKPQKVGGCRWTRCPRNHILSHVTKDMACSWFVAVGIWSFWGPFWDVSGTYHGVRGLQRARWHGKAKPHVGCARALPLFGRFECVPGLFWPKNCFFGPKRQFLNLRSATCKSRSRPQPLSFPLKLRVIVVHTQGYHASKLHLNLNHQSGVLLLSHFARAACLLLACLLLACLLAAKPGRSTLDPKKGYKTKTGSTSSVTLTLTVILTRSFSYW